MDNKELINKWKGNKRYTLRVIEAMPEDSFDFKPIGGMKSFKSQASHITTWLRTNFRHLRVQPLEKVRVTNKGEVLAALTEFFDAVITYLVRASDEELSAPVKMWYGKVSKASLISTMDNHLSHHRGQMVVYLRLQQVAPPAYIGW